MVTEVKPFPRASRQERLHCSRPTPMPAIARISVARGIHPSPLNRCPRAERESFETLVGGLVAVRPLPPPPFSTVTDIQVQNLFWPPRNREPTEISCLGGRSGHSNPSPQTLQCATSFPRKTSIPESSAQNAPGPSILSVPTTL